MTPPVFFAVAALGLMAPLMAQTPVHSMPGETGRAFRYLTISEEVEHAEAARAPQPGTHACRLMCDDLIRDDRNVWLFSDLNLLAPGEDFCPVKFEAIEGLEITAPELEEPANPVPVDPPSTAPDGVVTVGRNKPASATTAAPVPEPSAALLAVVAAAGLFRRRRVSTLSD